jgi:PIN domain nuclease of toxin-antitoxin system
VRVLLDTHVFLWSSLHPGRLSDLARGLLADGANEAFLSVVSAWEIAIKHAKRRLDLPDNPAAYIPSRMAIFGYGTLPIELGHALQVTSLPLLHRDPFDRLLIAQAQVESLPILTSDPKFARYGIEVIW